MNAFVVYTHPIQRILVLKLGEVLIRLIDTEVNAAVDDVDDKPRANVPAITTMVMSTWLEYIRFHHQTLSTQCIITEYYFNWTLLFDFYIF